MTEEGLSSLNGIFLMQKNEKKETSKSTILFWVIIIVLILVKLWLTSAQKLCALPHNRHDDQALLCGWLPV